jgi:TPR repeat protein
MVAAGCATATGPTPVGDATGRAEDAPSGEMPAAREARARTKLGWDAIARGDAAAATVPLREAIRLDPELIEARQALGFALQSTGDLDGAVDEYRSLLRLRPDAVGARYSLATALIAKQEWSSARRELEELVRLRPENISAHYSLGFVRYTLGDPNGAIQSFRRVIDLSPDHADARYNLALVLKVTHRDAEAMPEFLAAAHSGHARAQYFVGTAYARGSGVEADPALAITWWSRAAAQGSVEAAGALAELRQTALGRGRRGAAGRQAAEQAFRDYRATLWAEFPELARSGDDDTVGAALLRQGRGREAVPVLLREASALSEPAQELLETLYLRGVEGQVPAHDGRILDYFKTAAEEGQPLPRIALARCYAAGLGVPKDMPRAMSLLRATPHEDAQRLLQELQAASEAVTAPARP